MTERKEIIKNVLIILCVIILFFLSALVIRIIDPGLLEATHEFQRVAFFVIVTSMVTTLIYQIYYKPLAKEIKEEEIKEADQKGEKQLLFKPSVVIILIFLFFILIGISGIINPPLSKDATNVDFFACFIAYFFMIGLGLFLWYKTPVFIFAEDSVQIKSHLVYLFGIDKQTIIRYADIRSVSPDAKIKGNMYGVDRRYRIVISTNGTTQAYGLIGFNSDIVAKIYLRFREKLGYKVKLQ